MCLYYTDLIHQYSTCTCTVCVTSPPSPLRPYQHLLWRVQDGQCSHQAQLPRRGALQLSGGPVRGHGGGGAGAGRTQARGEGA